MYNYSFEKHERSKIHLPKTIHHQYQGNNTKNHFTLPNYNFLNFSFRIVKGRHKKDL